MHTNLFNWAAGGEAVYAKLQQDTKRDARQCHVYDTIGGICTLGAFYDVWHLRPLLGLIAITMLVTSLRVFIDNSNRNFAMHMMDWLAASGHKPNA